MEGRLPRRVPREALLMFPVAALGLNLLSLRASWKRMPRLECPHCGETHELSVSEAYLDSALKGGTETSG